MGQRLRRFLRWNIRLTARFPTLGDDAASRPEALHEDVQARFPIL